MKSKISFFNKTIFLKNLTLYWPIWGVYTLVLLGFQSFMLWISYNGDPYYHAALTEESMLTYLSDLLYMEAYIWIIAIMAIITGMAVFSYLYNSRSANMIHSLPVDRNQLFGTSVVSGFTFLAAPQVLTFFVSVLVCLTSGMTRVEYLAYWLLLCFGIDFIAFGVVTFCAFFTGQLVTMPVYVIILNCLSYLFYGVINLVVSTFAYGVSGSVINMEWVIWTSPFWRLYNDVQFYSIYSETTRKLEGLGVDGIFSILVYVVIAVVLYIAAYLIYKKRHVEQAGDLITVEWVKPIFRWGVGTSAAFLGSILFREIFREMGRPIALPVFIILLLVIGMVFYFVADMFVKKSFKVFHKKGWIRWGGFSAILLVSFGALYGYSAYSENFIPDKEDVASASVNYSYDCRFAGEDIEKVIEIQEMILEHKNEFRDWSYHNGDYNNIEISYTMENGRTYVRWYKVPLEGNGRDIYESIFEMEQEPHNFLSSHIGSIYDKIESFGNASVGYIADEDYDWNYLEVDAAGSAKLYEAILADAQAGLLQKYNMNYYYEEMYKNDSDVIVEPYRYSDDTAEIYMYYNIPEELVEKIKAGNLDYEQSGDYGAWFYDEETGMEYYYEKMGNKFQCEFSLQFGKDCTNIINALIEMDCIESADTIFWRDAEKDVETAE